MGQTPYLEVPLPVTNICHSAGEVTLRWGDCLGSIGFKIYTTTSLENPNWQAMTDVETGLMRINPGEPGDHVFALGDTFVTVSGAADKRFYRIVAAKREEYLVIDLSGGSGASSYPKTTLYAVPAGGWTDEYKTTKLVLRRLPVGKFWMGSPSEELGRLSNEDLHQVTLTQDFHIGVFEVTQRQWELVMGTKPSYCNNATYYASRPVEQVTYNDIRGSSLGAQWPANNSVDATSFMGKLRAKTGLTFDLPTEAQWEYACRAGTTTALNSGKNLTDQDQCPNLAEVGRYWYNGGSGYSQNCTTANATAKVGSYLPNAWGLYDMHGNVWDWCLDWYDAYGTSSVTDPKGATTGSLRLLRGGGWGAIASVCRSACRNSISPNTVNSNTGFRACVLPAPVP